MHKDPRPGIFDLGTHSLRYTIALGAVVGLLLSIFVHVAILIWRADSGGIAREKNNPQALESSMTARKNTPPPAPPAKPAVRY